MIPSKSYNVWYTINADHVASVYLQAGLEINENQYFLKTNQVLQLHPHVACMLFTDRSVIYPVCVKRKLNLSQ